MQTDRVQRVRPPSANVSAMAQRIEHGLMEAEAARLPAATRDAMAPAGALGGSLVIEDPNAAGDGSIRGQVGSGARDMSPALIRIDLKASAGGPVVHVRATGREGLVEQGIATRAVDRPCDAAGDAR